MADLSLFSSYPIFSTHHGRWEWISASLRGFAWHRPFFFCRRLWQMVYYQIHTRGGVETNAPSTCKARSQRLEENPVRERAREQESFNWRWIFECNFIKRDYVPSWDLLSDIERISGLTSPLTECVSLHCGDDFVRKTTQCCLSSW